MFEKSAHSPSAFAYVPGKIILAGEHAVVYGHPAISAPLDKGLRVVVSQKNSRQQGPVLTALSLGLSEAVSPDPDTNGPPMLKKALARMVQLFGERVRDLHFWVSGDLPFGKGLGSSAALAVGVTRGVYQYFSESISTEQITELAGVLEKEFHGNPSGIDHTTVARAKLTWFHKSPGSGVAKTIDCPRDLHFAVGCAMPHGGTKKAVSALKERISKNKAIFGRLFDDIAFVAKEMREALEDGSLAQVGTLMNINQGLLNALGLSVPELEAMCALAKREGALGAKLTGAGGGGAVIALCEGDAKCVVESFRAAGYAAFSSTLKSTI